MSKVKQDAGTNEKVITDFAELKPGTLVNVTFVADALGVSERTVRRMVQRHQLPPPISFGNASLWLIEHLLDYVSSASEDKMREAKNERKRLSGHN